MLNYRRIALSLLLFSAACGDETRSTSSSSVNDTEDDEGAACTEDKTCECADHEGVMACVDGFFDACDCSRGPDDEEEDDEPVVDHGTCEAGYYVGTFEGEYRSQAVGGLPIPVVALGLNDFGLPGRPGLSFTMDRTDDGEFYEIGNGYVKGLADGLFPFEGMLTGILDCGTGTFEGELDAYYQIDFTEIGPKFYFKGPVTGSYDWETKSFTNGTWEGDEYDPPPVIEIFPAGGNGTWSAEYSAPEAPAEM